MTASFRIPMLLAIGFLALRPFTVFAGQSLLDQLKSERDPGRRAEMALTAADTAFDSARDFYAKGEVHKGDAQLEEMTNALNECLSSLQEAHKAKSYKRAELKVAELQRRMKSLLDEIELQQRGWAEYTDRKLDEIHDKLLDGVMRK